MISYMIGLRLICQTSQFGSEARVSKHGGTGAGLMGLPGATPTGAVDTPMAKTLAKCVSTCIQMEMGQGSGMMDTVLTKITQNGFSAVQVHKLPKIMDDG